MDVVTKLSSWSDHTGDMEGPYHDTKTRCYVHIAEQDALCLRANTLADYYEANKQVTTVDSLEYGDSIIMSSMIKNSLCTVCRLSVFHRKI